MPTPTPTAGYCDWLAETMRRATALRRAGDLPGDVAEIVEGHILAALLAVKRSANNAPRPDADRPRGRKRKTHESYTEKDHAATGNPGQADDAD